ELAKAAYMYYIEGLTQKEIAEQLGIYRSTVSRMLTQAKKKKIVEIKIHNYDPEIFLMESELKSLYHLKNVEIAAVKETDTTFEKEEKTSIAAADWLRQSINDAATIGISWGSSLGNAVEKIEDRQ